MHRPARKRWRLPLGIASLLIAACKSPSTPATGGSEKGYAEVYGVDVPNDAEARQDAVARIQPANADEEFEALRKEIDEDAAKPDG